MLPKELSPARNDMIAQLRAGILARQGLQKTPGRSDLQLGLGCMSASFPDGCFPLYAVHEFCCVTESDKAATTGFIAGMLSSLMKLGGITLWISPTPHLFPHGFTGFGVEPDRIVFIHLPREKDLLWMTEEALKCNSLTAVVAQVRNLDFTASRRLQLAVEQSKVPGFIIRQTPHLNTTACVSRWRITSIASDTGSGLPGLGFPRWNVELLKMKNGKTGSWQFEWAKRGFQEISNDTAVSYDAHRQAV